MAFWCGVMRDSSVISHHSSSSLHTLLSYLQLLWTYDNLAIKNTNEGISVTNKLHKSIGWGLELSPDKVDSEKFSALHYGNESLSFIGFLDFVDGMNYPFKESDKSTLKYYRQRHINNQKIADAKWTHNFFETFYGEKSRFVLTSNRNIFSPDSLRPEEGDDSFLHAEFEALFADKPYPSTQAYAFRTPPYPTPYEVIGKSPVDSVRGLVFPKDSSTADELRISLKWEMYFGSDHEFHRELVEEHGDKWKLSAPFLNMALLEYSGVLKDNRDIFEMKPMVVYYWT